MSQVKRNDDSKKIVYIMTVGTGGKISNLAQGLVNAINLQKDHLKCVCLMPSSSPDSHAIAELVIDNFSASRMPVTIVGNFSEPDKLLNCRREFRDVLSNLKKEQVVINPTSGTKQMTAGATLAALDMGCGVLEFIGGDRQDGIVITGTERIEKVDSARLHAEQSVRNILVLLRNGNYSAAALLSDAVQNHFPTTASICQMLAAWNRMKYSDAARSAPLRDEFSATRSWLGKLNSAEKYSLERIADLMALAERDLYFSRIEEALSAIYRAVELMAKFHLVELGCPESMWSADHICKTLDLPPRTREELFRQDKKSKGRTLRLGLTDTLDILDNTAFTFCKLRYNKKVWKTLNDRNETRFGHGNKCVKQEDVKKLYETVYHYAVIEWKELKDMMEQSVFTGFEEIIEKEINNESE